MKFKCSVLRAPMAGILLALVTACGGGGGGGESPAPRAADSSVPAPVAASFDLGTLVGSWANCRTISATVSVLTEYVVTKLSDTSLSVRTNNTDYNAPACTGSPNTSGGPLLASTYALSGTKIVGEEEVQKFSISSLDGASSKNILVLRPDGKLYFGVWGNSSVDAEGYPTTLWTFGYTRE